jgi:cell division protein FtsL
MTRLNILILLAVLGSALMLVHSQYETRRLFMALETARKEAHRLEVDHDRLQVERRAQATPLRVEQIARQQLQMKTASPAITQYVSLAGKQTAAPVAPAVAPARDGRP